MLVWRRGLDGDPYPLRLLDMKVTRSDLDDRLERNLFAIAGFGYGGLGRYMIHAYFALSIMMGFHPY